jgi:hypothetical protein
VFAGVNQLADSLAPEFRRKIKSPGSHPGLNGASRYAAYQPNFTGTFREKRGAISRALNSAIRLLTSDFASLCLRVSVVKGFSP